MYRFWFFVLFSVLSASISVGLGVWVLRRRRDRAAVTFVAMLCLVALWAVTDALSLLVEPRSAKVRWNTVRLFAAIFVPPLWFLFALQYTRRLTALVRPLGVGLGVLGGAVTALTVTNARHGLVWGTVEYRTEPYAYLELETGIALGAYLVFSYLLLLGSLVVLLKVVSEARDAHRSQPAVLGVAILAPLLLNVVEFLNLLELPGIDLTQFGIVVASVLAGWALYSHRLFDLYPVDAGTVMDAIRDAVVVVTEDGAVADYNPAGRALLEGSPVIGAHVTAAVPFELDPSTYAEAPSTVEVTGTVDGETRHYLLDASPLERPGGTVLVFRDVTETRRQRRELERQAQHMERFASTVSHDLRNPLNVAQGTTEMLPDTEETALVRESHDRMQAIIDDALAFARSGQRISDTELVSLEETATDAWDSVETADASLRVEADATIHADRRRLRRLLENLYRNAVEHAGDSVRVRVGAVDPGATAGPAGRSTAESTGTGGRGADERSGLGFYVADDGSGIPPDDREAVFDHGYTTREDGTGFGLAIVDAVAAAHDWSVGVTDSRDGGARFEVTGVRFEDAPSAVRCDDDNDGRSAEPTDVPS